MVKTELMNHRYKKGDSIVQFKMYLSAAARDFDLDSSVGVTFGYNKIEVFKGGKVQYSYEYDRSIRNCVYKVRESITNDYQLGGYYTKRLVICDDYGLGYVLHVPASKIDNDRDIDFWIKQARTLLVSAFLNDIDCSTSRRIDFCDSNANGFVRMTDKVHAIANQLDYVLYSAPCLQLKGNEWNDRIAKTIDPDFINCYTTEITAKK